MSKIEWTEMTWNPTAGCTKVSPGCKNCYAIPIANRLQAIGVKGYENGFKLSLVPDRLNIPLKRKLPTMWFVNSMSDLFHEDIPNIYIEKVFDVIKKCPQHEFQILTKRGERLVDYFSSYDVPDNVWVGVSVENIKHGVPRIDYLRQVEAEIRFLSIEPLLEDLGRIDLSGIHWVIVGGESGNKARPMKKEWVVNIKEQCDEHNIPFFFKQWGEFDEHGVKRSKTRNGRLLFGYKWDAMPYAWVNKRH